MKQELVSKQKRGKCIDQKLRLKPATKISSTRLLNFGLLPKPSKPIQGIGAAWKDCTKHDAVINSDVEDKEWNRQDLRSSKHD